MIQQIKLSTNIVWLKQCEVNHNPEQECFKNNQSTRNSLLLLDIKICLTSRVILKHVNLLLYEIHSPSGTFSLEQNIKDNNLPPYSFKFHQSSSNLHNRIVMFIVIQRNITSFALQIVYCKPSITSTSFQVQVKNCMHL